MVARPYEPVIDPEISQFMFVLSFPSERKSVRHTAEPMWANSQLGRAGSGVWCEIVGVVALSKTPCEERERLEKQF